MTRFLVLAVSSLSSEMASPTLPRTTTSPTLPSAGGFGPFPPVVNAFFASSPVEFSSGSAPLVDAHSVVDDSSVSGCHGKCVRRGWKLLDLHSG